MKQYPFEYDHSRPFIAQVSDWMADVFYDILPESGFEVRDEQIYMAFQLERAFAEKQTMFAEAGVGTGKTLVYLLYSICYARYKRKPVVIACADESLIEQLVKPEGDIAKLTRHLNLAIDARLGKSPDQYACLVKLDEARFRDPEADMYEELYEGLPGFVRSHEPMQSFHAYGDRKNYPQLSDEQWSKMNWDPFQDCFVCDKRHRCGQTLSRNYYRQSEELIICSHDFYMEHVWTYEGRKREGQLPLLPDHCAVVFDEGHLLEAAAQKALTYRLKHSVFEAIITRLLEGQVREELALVIEEAIVRSETMFAALESRSQTIPGSDRKPVILDEQLVSKVNRLRQALSAIEEELVFESGLYTLNEYQLRIVEEHLETMQIALRLFEQESKLLCWVTDGQDGPTLVVMPRTVKEVLQERVFSSGMPIVFSSATLSVDGSFRFLADSLGIGNCLSFQADSPYDYKNRMELLAPIGPGEDTFERKMEAAAGLLERTGGRTLLLFPTKDELLRFKQAVPAYPAIRNMRIGFEGDGEISHLISSFQNDEQSVLAAVSLWEGLDVPGPSLSSVIIWSLPYPPEDPVYMAKRKESAAPFEEVDMPYMLLRLRQGIGRLIRSRDDSGIVSILSGELYERQEVRARVEAVLPKGVRIKEAKLF
ncbi:ATP-dependent DNA helicase [Paenibacillus sp. GCM10012303]|uniref:ATP-dependent DNA helicase n=1 Tax=Paenibacillus sp. GCM10012303 TaxID=3317340 RepID=UPI003606A983